jgi:hypothetical protein
MKTSVCPRDGHGRFFDDSTERLNCSVKECRCGECHKALSERERKDWTGGD